MSEQTQVAEVVNDDQVLDYTQGIRRQLIGHLTKDGKMPADLKEQSMLLQTLDGMDRVALGRKRIKVEEKANNNQAAMAGLVAHMLTNVRRGRGLNADGTPIAAAGSAPARSAPVLSDSIPEPVLVPGETSAAPMRMSWEDFTSEFGSAKPVED